MTRNSSVSAFLSPIRRWLLNRGQNRIFVAVFCVLCLSMAPETKAQGFLDSLFGNGMGYAYPNYGYGGGYYAHPRHWSYRYAARRRHAYNPKFASFRRSHKSQGRSAYAPAPLNDGSVAVCVRTCDGYFFPAGNFVGKADIPRQESTCHSLCPNAETKLYVMPHDSDKIDEATSARDGRLYSDVAAKTQPEQDKDKTCSCQGAASDVARTKALFSDPTLQKGDSVMTSQGLRVFRGARHFPFNAGDFVSLDKTPGLRREMRGVLAAIDHARKTREAHESGTIAKSSAPRPDAAEKPGEGKALASEPARGGGN